MKLLFITVLVVFLSGCGVTTDTAVSIDTDDITYVKDSRTDLCFAFVGARKKIKVNPGSLGMSQVPCSEEVLREIQ